MLELFLSAPILYAAILGAYLLVVPLVLMNYFKARWYKTGGFERAFICFLVFFFLPGLLVISPFLNFRPEPRKV